MQKKWIISVTVIIIFSIITSICMMDFSKTHANSTSNYRILVDVEESRLYVFKDNELQKVYICSGGKPSTPSPIGTWTIISKGKWGEGFGGSWMGFNVPWGKFGIHGNSDVRKRRLGEFTWMY